MNTILERVHQVGMSMLCTAEVDTNGTCIEYNISNFIVDTYWVTVLKASPVAVVFGRDVLFDIPYIANWHKIGEYMQK